MKPTFIVFTVISCGIAIADLAAQANRGGALPAPAKDVSISPRFLSAQGSSGDQTLLGRELKSLSDIRRQLVDTDTQLRQLDDELLRLRVKHSAALERKRRLEYELARVNEDAKPKTDLPIGASPARLVLPPALELKSVAPVKGP